MYCVHGSTRQQKYSFLSSCARGIVKGAQLNYPNCLSTGQFEFIRVPLNSATRSLVRGCVITCSHERTFMYGCKRYVINAQYRHKSSNCPRNVVVASWNARCTPYFASRFSFTSFFHRSLREPTRTRVYARVYAGTRRINTIVEHGGDAQANAQPNAHAVPNEFEGACSILAANGTPVRLNSMQVSRAGAINEKRRKEKGNCCVI